MLTEFTTFAKGLGLSQEAAQKFVEREVALQQAADKDLAAQVTKQKAEWETQARSDAEIGGAKYDENLGIANKALDQFGSPALRDMLKTTPFGQHPDVLRFLVKVGQAISQDNFVPAGGAPPAPKRFYTNSQHAA